MKGGSREESPRTDGGVAVERERGEEQKAEDNAEVEEGDKNS